MAPTHLCSPGFDLCSASKRSRSAIPSLGYLSFSTPAPPTEHGRNLATPAGPPSVNGYKGLDCQTAQRLTLMPKAFPALWQTKCDARDTATSYNYRDETPLRLA